jgi:hypothetical protein
MERMGDFLGLRLLGDINTSEDPVIAWVVEDTVPQDGVAMVAAAPGIGKSLLAHHIGACVVTGEKVFGVLAVRQGAVAYVDLDMHREKIAALRATAAFAGVGAADVNAQPYYITGRHDSMDLRQIEVCEAVIADLRRIPNLSLVVFDVFSDVHHGKERDPDDMTDVSRSLAHIAATLHVGVLLPHHLRKGGGNELEDIRGTTAITAKLDAAFLLTSGREEDDTQGIIQMVQRKARLTEPASPRYLDLSMEMDADGTLLSYRFDPVKRGAKRGRPATASEVARDHAAAMLTAQPALAKRELVAALIGHGTTKTTAYRVAGDLFSQIHPVSIYTGKYGNHDSQTEQGKEADSVPGKKAGWEALFGAPVAADGEGSEPGTKSRGNGTDAPPASDAGAIPKSTRGCRGGTNYGKNDSLTGQGKLDDLNRVQNGPKAGSLGTKSPLSAWAAVVGTGGGVVHGMHPEAAAFCQAHNIAFTPANLPRLARAIGNELARLGTNERGAPE